MPRLVHYLLLGVLTLLLATALALGDGDDGDNGGGGGGGGGGSSDGSYEDDLYYGSLADTYYEVYRCSEVELGVYTTGFAEAITDSSPSKSRYLSHNARLYIDGVLRDRSRTRTENVSFASETKYVTSLKPSVAEYSISCPKAVIAKFEANTWHKGISLDDETEVFYKLDTYEGE